MQILLIFKIKFLTTKYLKYTFLFFLLCDFITTLMSKQNKGISKKKKKSQIISL